MNRYLITKLRLFLLIALAAGAGIAPLAAQVLNWDVEDILTDTQESGANPDMYITADGDLHVSFWNRELNQLDYAHRDKSTGNWTLERVDDQLTMGYASKILVDPSGIVHIAFHRDILNVAHLYHAMRINGNWTIEEVLQDSEVGPYGADLNFPSHIQPSMDLVLQPDEEPAILYFDGRIETYHNCVAGRNYEIYDLDMDIVARSSNGSWQHFDMPDVPYTGSTNCLFSGDRFGEFCKFFARPGNQYYGVTTSLHNHDLLWFRTASPGFGNWTFTRIDSTSRFLTGIDNAEFREGFEWVDGEMSGDSIVHLVYGVSDTYGFGFGKNNRRTFFYMRFYPDSLGIPDYLPYIYDFDPPPRDNNYRRHLSLTTVGPDTIFIAWHDNVSNDVVVGNSTDAGVTWSTDTLMRLVTTARMPIKTYDDSLFMLIYNSATDQLLMASRAVASPGWLVSEVTQSESRGNYNSFWVERTGGDDEIHLAYTDRYAGQVWYGNRSNGNWTHESVSAEDIAASDVQIILNVSGEPCIAFTDRSTETVQIACKSSGNWVIGDVDDTHAARDLSMIIGSDSIYIAYQDLDAGNLILASAADPSGPWTLSIVDSSSTLVGRYPHIREAADKSLHLSYLDQTNNWLKYAYRTPGGAWQYENVTESLGLGASFNSLALDTAGSARIAFRDEVDNKPYYAERTGPDTWEVSRIIGDLGADNARPIRLITDAKNKPWVLYNFAFSLQEMRLVRRDASKTWQRVSVDNSLNIGSVFDFQLVGTDFYVIGLKTLLGNKGLGMLYAEDGVLTRLDPALETLGFNLYPNPATDRATLSLNLPESAAVSLRVFDLQGRDLGLLADLPPLPPGPARIQLSLEGLPRGLYICRLTVGSTSGAFKLIKR